MRQSDERHTPTLSDAPRAFRKTRAVRAYDSPRLTARGKANFNNRQGARFWRIAHEFDFLSSESELVNMGR